VAAGENCLREGLKPSRRYSVGKTVTPVSLDMRLGDTGGATRRIARCGEFSEARWRMLQALAEDRGNRLVLISGPEGDERVEIAHEALVTQWPRFQRWLQAAAGDKRTLDELIERAARWATPEGWPATKVEQEAWIDNASRPVNVDSKSRDQYLATGADLERLGVGYPPISVRTISTAPPDEGGPLGVGTPRSR
jgi:hypothetical protein